MNKKLSAVFAALLMLFLLIISSCGVGISPELIDGESASLADGTEPDTTEPAQTASPEDSAAPLPLTYTMDDIYALENTEHFAKNTLEHIFDGTINSKGKATGYHYTLIEDSRGSIIEGTESAPDAHGVFTAKVTVDGVKKNGFSSFYPESWTPQQVVDTINEAYEDALSAPDNPHGELWIGYSGDLEINMYLNNRQQITTAYPIYEGD